MKLDFYQQIPPNTARAILYTELTAATEHLSDSINDQCRLVWLPFGKIPRLENFINALTTSLAEVAFNLWPHWYGVQNGVNPDFTPDKKKPKTSAFKKHWFCAAQQKCARAELPLIEAVPNATQLEQLALAIALHDLVIGIGVSNDQHGELRLLGLAQTADWLAREAKVRVAVFLPKSVQQNPALDCILYNAISLVTDDSLEKFKDNFAEEFDRETGTKGLSRYPFKTKTPDEECYRLSPVIGHPHPYSPGEQALARAIAADSELVGLFGFNLYVYSVKGSRFMVDLLWQEGRLVIEVDGYSHHSRRSEFINDRQRDFELLISGYQVFRITHDEAVAETTNALTKIREAVRLIRSRHDFE